MTLTRPARKVPAMTDQPTARVRIAYDPADLKRAGSVVDVPVADAKELIRQGRAEAAAGEDLYDSTSDTEGAAHVSRGRTKAELLELAQAHGLELAGTETKAELVDALTAAGVDPA